MVVDTSALIAVLNGEPTSARIESAILAAPRIAISAANFVEASVVADSTAPPDGMAELDELIRAFRVDVVPVTREHAQLARAAYHRFGKGRHPAALNFGDCFSYALARALGEPLLFVGNDFGRTDVEVAAY
jgi:ribonuclease VapC